MRISIETPFIDADRFSFTLCLSSGSRFSGMLRFSDVDSRKWNSPAKFRTTGINRSRLNPIFFPSANFCLPKSKIKKKRGKKNREKLENLIKKSLPKKLTRANLSGSATVQSDHEQRAGKSCAIGSRCRCTGGWKGSRVVHRSFSRVVSGRHTAEAFQALSKPLLPLPRILSSPLSPRKHLVLKYPMQWRDPPLLSILPRGCRGWGVCQGGQRAERYAEAGIRHKSSFSKARAAFGRHRSFKWVSFEI